LATAPAGQDEAVYQLTNLEQVIATGLSEAQTEDFVRDPKASVRVLTALCFLRSHLAGLMF